MPETNADGVTLVTMLCHQDGGTIRTEITMKPTKNDPQGIGSTITYSRRYALMAIAGVAPDDDDGNAGSAPSERKSASQSKKDDIWPKLTAAINSAKTLDDVVAAYNQYAPTLPASWVEPADEAVASAFIDNMQTVPVEELTDWGTANEDRLDAISKQAYNLVVEEVKRRRRDAASKAT
jgi:hypothetical protein